MGPHDDKEDGLMNVMKQTKMKKMMGVLALTMIMMMVFTGCAPKQAAAPAPAPTPEATAPAEGAATDSGATGGVDLEAIKKKGKLVLGTSADYPPYEFHKMVDGKDTYMGFDIAIAKDIAAAAGVELEIVDMKFDGLLAALQTGKIDMIIAGMNPTDERKKSVDFSIEYYEATQTMLVQTSKVEGLKTDDSFAGKKIGVQKGTTQEKLALEKFTKSEIVSIPKIPDMIMALESGKLDGVILNETVAVSYDESSDGIMVNGQNLGSEGGVAVAMPKGSDEFKSLVDKTLQDLIDSGKIKTYITEAALAVEQ